MAKETMAEVLPRVINSLLRGVHTAIPGKIEKYDRSTFRAEVTPSVKHLTMKNKEIEIKPISDVPVLMFGGTSGIVDVELVKGDNVLLIICESGIGGWKSSKGNKQIAPDDLAHHELTNAIAIPCVIPDGKIPEYTSIPRIKIDKNKDITVSTPLGNLTLATGDSVIWQPNILPSCLFTKTPHGGTGAGISKLKGGTPV